MSGFELLLCTSPLDCRPAPQPIEPLKSSKDLNPVYERVLFCMFRRTLFCMFRRTLSFQRTLFCMFRIMCLSYSDTLCETCKKGLFHSTITSSKNGKKHKIKQSLNCKSKNICYLINCKHCNQQYTGETKREFHLRLNSHTSDIKLNQRSTGMVRHFSECGSENIQPIILEKVRSTDPFIRKAREQFYIDLLETEINAQ